MSTNIETKEVLVHVHDLAAPCQMRFGMCDVPLAEGLVSALEAAPAKSVQS